PGAGAPAGRSVGASRGGAVCEAVCETPGGGSIVILPGLDEVHALRVAFLGIIAKTFSSRWADEVCAPWETRPPVPILEPASLPRPLPACPRHLAGARLAPPGRGAKP